MTFTMHATVAATATPSPVPVRHATTGTVVTPGSLGVLLLLAVLVFLIGRHSQRQDDSDQTVNVRFRGGKR